MAEVCCRGQPTPPAGASTADLQKSCHERKGNRKREGLLIGVSDCCFPSRHLQVDCRTIKRAKGGLCTRESRLARRIRAGVPRWSGFGKSPTPKPLQRGT